MAEQEASNPGVKVYDISGQQPVLGELPHDEVQEAVSSGRFTFPQGKIPAFSPDGELGELDAHQAPEAFKAGYTYATPDMVQQHKYGTPEQQLKAGAEGVFRGVATAPIANAIEEGFGVEPEDVRGREHANPWTAGGGEALGLIAPTIATGGGALAEKLGVEGAGAAAKTLGEFTQAGLLEKAGAGIAETLPKATTPLARIGSQAAKLAGENAIYQTNAELGSAVLQDPDQDIGHAAADVGLAALLGGVAGGGLGTVPELWAAAKESKLGKILGDITDKMGGTEAAAAKGAEPAAAEGPKGAKNWQDPNVIYGEAPPTPEALKAKYDDATEAVDAINHSYRAAPADTAKIVEELGNLKLQEKWQAGSQGAKLVDKLISKLPEEASLGDITKIYEELELPLKDALNTGKQSAIDKIEDTLNRVKDGMVHDHILETHGPEAAQSYLAAKEAQGTAKTELTNALDELKNAHLGPEPKISTDEKEAPKAEKPNELPHGVFSSAVGLASYLMGHEKDLNHVIKSLIYGKLAGAVGHLLPKPIQYALMKYVGSGADVSAKGFKAMVDVINATMKGENATSRAAKSIFKAGTHVATEAMAKPGDKKKIDQAIDRFRENPEKALDIGGHTAYYLPEQGAALGMTAMSAVKYLDALKPRTQPQGPLDGKIKPNAVAEARYNSALNIAQNPLGVISKIHSGSITRNDITDLKTMYPGLYKSMSSKIFDEVIKKSSQEQIIPYKTRLGVSMFLGQPLDSSMSPQSIMGAQPSPQQQAKKQLQENPHLTSSGSSALNRIAQGEKTSAQAREERSQK